MEWRFWRLTWKPGETGWADRGKWMAQQVSNGHLIGRPVGPFDTFEDAEEFAYG